MNCLLCGHEKVHKHGKTEKGYQRDKCPCCGQTFLEHFGSLYYGRHLTPEEVYTILQSHAEGSSLRGVSRISRRAYGTVVSLVRDASNKAQLTALVTAVSEVFIKSSKPQNCLLSRKLNSI